MLVSLLFLLCFCALVRFTILTHPPVPCDSLLLRRSGPYQNPPPPSGLPSGNKQEDTPKYRVDPLEIVTHRRWLPLQWNQPQCLRDSLVAWLFIVFDLTAQHACSVSSGDHSWRFVLGCVHHCVVQQRVTTRDFPLGADTPGAPVAINVSVSLPIFLRVTPVCFCNAGQDLAT